MQSRPVQAFDVFAGVFLVVAVGCLTGVVDFVAVTVGDFVAVAVGDFVAVPVGDFVAVTVGDFVAVTVGDFVAVTVGGFVLVGVVVGADLAMVAVDAFALVLVAGTSV